MCICYTIMNSPLGELVLTANSAGLTGIQFGTHQLQTSHSTLTRNDKHPILQQAKLELEEFFNKERERFTVPLSFNGTPFQTAVWDQLLKIEYGLTKSYQEIAEAIENKKAVRAVGQANKANKIPIIIPCHRVIGKNKKMVGYAGKEITKKQLLLKLEGVLK